MTVKCDGACVDWDSMPNVYLSGQRKPNKMGITIELLVHGNKEVICLLCLFLLPVIQDCHAIPVKQLLHLLMQIF